MSLVGTHDGWSFWLFLLGFRIDKGTSLEFFVVSEFSGFGAQLGTSSSMFFSIFLASIFGKGLFFLFKGLFISCLMTIGNSEFFGFSTIFVFSCSENQGGTSELFSSLFVSILGLFCTTGAQG